MNACISPIVVQNLILVLDELSLLFRHFKNTTAYHFGLHLLLLESSTTKRTTEHLHIIFPDNIYRQQLSNMR